MNNMNLCYQDNVDDLINLINFDEDSVVKEDNLFEDSSTNSIIFLDKKVDGGQRLPKRRKIPKSSAIQGNTQALMEVLLDENQQVVKRSRAARPVLYAFPHYDKCDSLLYFANAVSRHTNSGDFCSLAKLFLTHIDQHCDITLDVVPCKKPNARVLLEIFRFSCLMFPDYIMCVNTTKVEGNLIKATLLSKHTECRRIIRAIQNNTHTEDSIEHIMLKQASKENLKSRIKQYNLLPTEEERVAGLIDSEVNLVVNLKMDVTITIDSMSNKISSLRLDSQLTSVSETPAVY